MEAALSVVDVLVLIFGWVDRLKEENRDVTITLGSEGRSEEK